MIQRIWFRYGYGSNEQDENYVQDKHGFMEIDFEERNLSQPRAEKIVADIVKELSEGARVRRSNVTNIEEGHWS